MASDDNRGPVKRPLPPPPRLSRAATGKPLASPSGLLGDGPQTRRPAESPAAETTPHGDGKSLREPPSPAKKPPAKKPPNATVLDTVRPHWAGEVANAELTANEQPVVAVVLPARFRPKQKAIAALASNARAAAGMRVPGVLQYVDVLNFADGRLGIGYQPLEGEGVRSLRELLQRETPTLGFRVGVLRQLAHTLASLHEAGIRHGALTLDAVLVDREGKTHVGDFGLSRLVGDAKHERFDDALRPHTPERVLGLEDDLEDLYLWGLVGYRLLGRRDPFAGGGFDDIRRRHAIEDVPPLRSLDPGVPPELAGVIERCLVKEPGDRFRSMTVLERSFVTAQRGAGVRTPFDGLGLVDEDAEISSSGAIRPDALARKAAAAEATPLRIDTHADAGTFTPEAAMRRADEDEARLHALVASVGPSAADGPSTQTDPDTVQGPLERTPPPPVAHDPTEARRPVWIYGAAALLLLSLVGLGLWRLRGGGSEFEDGDESLAAAALATQRTPASAPTARDDGESQSGPSNADPDPDPDGADGITDGETTEPVDALVLDDPTPTSAPFDTHGDGGGTTGDDPDADDTHPEADDESSVADSDESAKELERRAKSAAAAGRTGAAISLYKQVLDKSPRDRSSLAALGNLYFNRSDYRRAATYFGKAVGTAPRDAGYRISLGDAYYKLGRYQDAKKHYAKAKSLGSNSAQRRLDKVNTKLGQ